MVDRNECTWDIVGSGMLTDETQLRAKYNVVPATAFSGSVTSGYIDPGGILDLLDTNEHITQSKLRLREFEDADRPFGEPFVASRFFLLIYEMIGSTEFGIRQYRNCRV